MRPLSPSDPLFGSQYYLDNANTLNGIPVDVNPDSAWALASGSGVIVAIFDDGVAFSDHPDMPPGAAVGIDKVDFWEGGLIHIGTICMERLWPGSSWQSTTKLE